MFRSHATKIVLIVLFALSLGYFDLPSQYQTLPGTPDSFQNAKVHLGLDLQGGSQLDYKIDLRKVPNKDRKAIVEGVKTVINRRVNSLGVSEPNIYTSTMGDEEHLIVELAGVKDLNEAKKVVGKTIQLEFKEKREKEDPKHKENVTKYAESALQKILNKEQFETTAQEEAQASPDKVNYQEEDFKFGSDIEDKTLAEAVANGAVGKIIPRLIEANNGYTVQDEQLVELKGLFIVKVLDKRNTSTAELKDKTIKVSHILVAYRGTDKAGSSIFRTKEDAQKLAKELLAKIKGGAKFEDIAKESSDEPGAKDTAGALSAPVALGGAYVEGFTNAALMLSKKGELSPVVETPLGFHIIRADDLNQIKYSYLFFSTAPDPWLETGLTGEHFQRGHYIRQIPAADRFDQIQR